ncbi:Alpha-actinin-4 [Balamuthia mandrillaris]
MSATAAATTASPKVPLLPLEQLVHKPTPTPSAISPHLHPEPREEQPTTNNAATSSRTTPLDGAKSVLTVNREKKQVYLEMLHEKTFRGWINAKLASKGLRSTLLKGSLVEELKSGLVLIQLMEALSGKSIPEKWHAKPEKDIQKQENLTIALDFAKEEIGAVVLASSQDFMTGNRKMILGLIWRLILHYQVLAEPDGTQSMDGDKNNASVAKRKTRMAKLKLLQWCQQQTEGYNGVDIKDFQDSWLDGLGFCALLHSFDEQLVDFDSLSSENAKENLETAFKLAEEELDIPQLLDPADICHPDPLRRPDDQCFITYLSHFPLAFLMNGQGRQKKEEQQLRRAEEEHAEAALFDSSDASEYTASSTKNESQHVKWPTEERCIGKLQVVVEEAKFFKKRHPYCLLFLERQKERTKAAKKKTYIPQWDNEFEFYVSKEDAKLEVRIFNHNRITHDKPIGDVDIWIKELPDGRPVVSSWYPVVPSKKRKHKNSSLKNEEESIGEIKLTLLYKKDN